MQNPENSQSTDRRSFMKAGSLATAATLLPSIASAQGQGSEIKVALIGCGGRGTGAASQSLNVPGTKLVAMCSYLVLASKEAPALI